MHTCTLAEISVVTFAGNLVCCLSVRLSKVLLEESFGFIARDCPSNRCQVHRRPSDRCVSECLKTGKQIRSSDTSGPPPPTPQTREGAATITAGGQTEPVLSYFSFYDSLEQKNHESKCRHVSGSCCLHPGLGRRGS